MSAPAPPFLISWNVTKRCNLLCGHCYLDACELSGADAVPTDEALSYIGQIGSLSPGCMLVLTGGEPLLRDDIFQLAGRASSLGLSPVVGTNGTLLSDEIIKRLLGSGVQGIGVSLDSLTPALHDRIRGVEGAWTKTVTGIEALTRSTLSFQLQFTLTKENMSEIPAFVEFAEGAGAKAVNFFFLVCTGRGQKATDLSPAEYESALSSIAAKEEEYRGRVMVRARCAPHLVRVAGESDPDSALFKGGTSGCIAGRGYIRISPEGFVTPCPYIPVREGSPSLREKTLSEIWENDPAFKMLRNPAYKGRCAECEYSDSCGGCRARALAATGDLMAEDPWCMHEPKGIKKEATAPPAWSPDAEERLENIPAFIRPMIKKGLERYASNKGIKVITPELMKDLREKAGR
ncbi:MAG: radical SAM protein [Deltaproteobacteria bacterium]|nr:radical SAM protein [Deltaproteobacteria bacterium]MBZ0219393.1 radical SAM protein [Deltaproteobacteria bacterium]